MESGKTSGALEFRLPAEGARRLVCAPADASVAQWQSNGFVNRRSSVQSRPLAPSSNYFQINVLEHSSEGVFYPLRHGLRDGCVTFCAA